MTGNRGDSVKLLVHALFDCSVCGTLQPFHTLAPVIYRQDHSIALGKADEPPGPLVCRKCMDAERELKRQEYNKKQRQRRWANRMQAKVRGGEA